MFTHHVQAVHTAVHKYKYILCRAKVKEDMARNQMTTEMADDRKHWHVMIQAGTLQNMEADR